MTARKVDRHRARIQAALEGKPAPDLEWEAVEAFRLTTKRIGAAIGRELCLDEKTIQDWGNIESGDRPPNLTVLYVTQLALEMRPLPAHRAECFAALDFIERQLGRVAYDLPPAEVAVDESASARARRLAHSVREFAEFVAAVEKRPADRQGRAKAHRELAELHAALHALMERGF